ncbi:MAG TPA: PaaI family thioesterase [Bacillales bacterium]|nr:PaaI family thioesterase [Bacillales bacterium]
MTASLKSLRDIYEESPFFKHFGFEFVEFTEGKVTLKLDVHHALLNTGNILHGGVYATLIDNIIGLTACSITNQPLVTVQLNVHFLASVKTGTIYATAKVDRIGRQLVTGEGEIVDEKGTLLAKGSGTFKQMN